MRILLTGPRGNLGTALRDAGQSQEGVSLDRGEWGKLYTGLSGADVVIHAASDLLTPVWKDPKNVIESNIITAMDRDIDGDARFARVSKGKCPRVSSPMNGKLTGFIR